MIEYVTCVKSMCSKLIVIWYEHMMRKLVNVLKTYDEYATFLVVPTKPYYFKTRVPAFFDNIEDRIQINIEMSPFSVRGLSHWGWVVHICANKLNIVVSDNGLYLGRRKVIIWTNAIMILIRPRGTNFSETQIETYVFSFRKLHL